MIFLKYHFKGSQFPSLISLFFKFFEFSPSKDMNMIAKKLLSYKLKATNFFYRFETQNFI